MAKGSEGALVGGVCSVCVCVGGVLAYCRQLSRFLSPQVGSPTSLADQATEMRLREAAQRGGHTLYVPRGALWGGEDIQRMDDRGVLQVGVLGLPGEGGTWTLVWGKGQR